MAPQERPGTGTRRARLRRARPVIHRPPPPLGAPWFRWSPGTLSNRYHAQGAGPEGCLVRRLPYGVMPPELLGGRQSPAYLALAYARSLGVGFRSLWPRRMVRVDFGGDGTGDLVANRVLRGSRVFPVLGSQRLARRVGSPADSPDFGSGSRAAPRVPLLGVAALSG